MKTQPDSLLTPVYLKLSAQTPWPADSVFYLLAAEGLYFCRNHGHFRSSVLSPRGPSELAPHKEFLQINYPKLRRRMLELIVGFFHVIADRYCAEAGALLFWDQPHARLRVVVPQQFSRIRIGNGYVIPMDLQYSIPQFPPQWSLIGDIHSHADGMAYASETDAADEIHRDGLHIVVGRVLSQDPPQFRIECAVDGARFVVPDASAVFEGYRRRATRIPRSWLERVNVEPFTTEPFRQRRTAEARR